VDFPPDFDATSYRDRYSDLKGLNRTQLRRHWRREGRRNGRNASTIEHREQLLACLGDASHLLEIGPFDNPSLEGIRRPGMEIDYADHLSQGEMKARAKQIPGRHCDRVPPIRYVLSQGGYQQISQRYDGVVSHHCLEHQPDFIGHLNQVAQLLKPGGVYLCTLPNQYRCFDRYLPPSTLIDVITAHLEKRTHPPLQAVIEHRCFTVQNWLHAPDPTKELPPNLPAMLNSALQEYQNHSYVDVHCWKFDNQQFRQLLSKITLLGYLPKGTHWRTYNLGNEFAAVITFHGEQRASISAEPPSTTMVS